MIRLVVMILASLLAVACSVAAPPAGPVTLDGHALRDDRGHFPGLGATYMTALHRAKFDRDRLHSDLKFLSDNHFDYIRVLTMVGWWPAWDGREIAPVSFTSKAGKRVEAWPDYWRQLSELIDMVYEHGLRTQLTVGSPGTELEFAL